MQFMAWKVIYGFYERKQERVGVDFFRLFFSKRRGSVWRTKLGMNKKRARKVKAGVKRAKKKEKKRRAQRRSQGERERERDGERVIGKERAVRPINRCWWKPLIRQTLHRLTTTRTSRRLVHIQDFVRPAGNVYLYVHTPSTTARYLLRAVR